MSTGIDGAWYQVDCKNSQYFLCKRPTGTVCNSTPPPPVIVTPSPTNPSGCNSTTLFDSGTFTSPNYPNVYGVSYCVYRLSTLGPYRIGLYFTDFTTYSGYTYTNVYDSNGSRLAQLTGSSVPSPFYSSSNTMTVSFSSPNSPGYRGFSAKFLSF